MEDILLNIDNLSFSYDTTKIFEHLSLDVKNNEIVTIIGPNNCGKTTLIKILCGILASNDRIILDNISLNKKNLKKYARKIGVMFSNNENQFLFDDIYTELAFPLENLKYSKIDIKNRLLNIIKEFNLINVLETPVDDLDKFEKTKLLIALSVVHSPKIAFLDDPFQGLSKAEKKKIISTIKKINVDENIAFLITTTNLDEILYSDYVYVIDEQKVILEGNYLEILKHDNKLSKIGIEIPTMIDVSLKLQFYDLIKDIYLDADRMVLELWK